VTTPSPARQLGETSDEGPTETTTTGCALDASGAGPRTRTTGGAIGLLLLLFVVAITVVPLSLGPRVDQIATPATPQQQQVDPKEPAQNRDFQQRGDGAGPKSPETSPGPGAK